jgi:class 3 adenylate cyclase
MAELPSGTVTFLFTDLEGSTRLWEEQPDAMRDALARHDTILRTAVGSHRGHLVKMRGDGVHAAFTTPRDAVGAAVAAQRALAAEPWGETGPLWVRMGIHTGEAQYRDGDYYGTAVNPRRSGDVRRTWRADRAVACNRRSVARRPLGTRPRRPR